MSAPEVTGHDDPVVVTDVGAGVMELRLHRPATLNALNAAAVLRLHHELDRLQFDTTARVVVLTGSGRGFCSGADLAEDEASLATFLPGFAGSAQRKWYEIQKRFSSLIVKLRRIPQPVVAAVNGPAVGAGFSLALASDIRILDPTAFFVAAQVHIGQASSEMGATYFLPRLVGGRAAEILLTGRRVQATEAERIGLANGVTAPGECVTRAHEVARDLAAKAPLALRLSKEALEVSYAATSIEQAVAADDRSQVLCTLTDDLAEGQRAFLQGRAPGYRG
jgi:enoyl-CoA hydratase